MSKIDSGLSSDETIKKIVGVCTSEFCDNGLVGEVKYIPPEEVRTTFESSVYDYLRLQNYFQAGRAVYVPLKNNGLKNLGILAIEGVVPRFLTLDEEDRNLVLDYLGAQSGQILASARSLEKTRLEAQYDHLTGLLKKEVFLEKLEQEIQRISQCTEKSYLAVVMLDLDKFHNYNANFGHPQGDLVLKEVGRILRAGRPTDSYGRYGGEEFAVLLRNTNLEGALNAAERIRTAIANCRIDTSQVTFCNPEEPYHLTPDRVTVSLGVAAFPEQTKNVGELLKLADTALFLAKGNGRNDLGRNRVKTII